jgi:hypothetical protein
MPTVLGYTSTTALLVGNAPILAGNTTDTGLTATAPNPAGAITASTTPFYCYVS